MKSYSKDIKILQSSEIPIYVVSLADEISRKQSLQDQFPKNFDQFLFVEAVDFRGKKINELNGLYKECSHNKKSPLTPTEIACSLSHVKVLKLFLKTTYKRCVILEDDVIGCDLDINLVFRSMQITENGLFILGGQEGMKNNEYLCGYENEDGFYAIPRLARHFLYRTCCYSVDRYWAQKIIDEQSNCLTRADNWKHLTKPRNDVFYLKILKHPTDLSNSYIQVERNLFKDNLTSLLYRNIAKIYLFSLTLFGTLRKVK